MSDHPLQILKGAIDYAFHDRPSPGQLRECLRPGGVPLEEFGRVTCSVSIDGRGHGEGIDTPAAAHLVQALSPEEFAQLRSHYYIRLTLAKSECANLFQ